jgi:hypothetical protein
MLTARILNPAEIPWARLDAFPDRTIFQTRAWVDFVSETQRATPVIAELRAGSDVAGYFTGLTIERFGIRILGSSFPGWATPYIGFNLMEGVPAAEALAAVERMAFGELKCLHMEISDRRFTPEDGRQLGFECKFYESYETDLTKTEDEIFKAMTSACRRCVRKAEKSGVTIQHAGDIEFADEYYAQLLDVFDKQKLAPSYGVERVRALIRHLLPTGNLLLVRALAPDGKCIGTGIYPGLNRVAQFWGNASYRATQILRPNETLHWYAMRYWKSRGVKRFDWGGGGTYKEKYGPYPLAVPWFAKSKYRLLSTLRNQALNLFRMRQRLAGRLRGKKTAPAENEEE